MLLWTNEYELGIDVIDSQHRRIVDYINQLDTLRQNHTQASDRYTDLTEVLHNLMDYTLSHFAFEESLLEESGYPSLLEHQLCHKNFTIMIERQKQAFEQGTAPHQVAQELVQLLKEWLIDHILNDDKQYVATVQKALLGAEPESRRGWLRSAIKQHFH